MSEKKHWPRWIKASVASYFEANSDGIRLFVEGEEFDESESPQHIELRIDGPWTTEFTRNQYRVYGEVNVVITTAMDQKDSYKHERGVGTVLDAFRNIPIFRCGDGPDDNDTLVGCWSLIQNERRRERVVTSNFGQIQPRTKIEQSTVEGHYEMCLTLA